MLRAFLSGLSAYRRVPGTLLKHGLWPWQFLPALISLRLGAGLFAAYSFSAAPLHGWLDGLIHLRTGWLDRAFSLGLTALALLALLTGFVFLHKHLALILLSPLQRRIVSGDSVQDCQRSSNCLILRSTRMIRGDTHMLRMTYSGFGHLRPTVELDSEGFDSAPVPWRRKACDRLPEE